MVLSAETQSLVEAILSSDEIILPSSPHYIPESQCWGFQERGPETRRGSKTQHYTILIEDRKVSL